MTSARVDVGLVTWNSRDLTLDALHRLFESEQGCELRVFVRDNGSVDGTSEAIARAFPEVVLDAGRENLGFAAGMNRLIAQSDAPWFFPLNSDAWPEDHCISTLLAAAEAHPRAAAVAPRLLRPDGSLEHSTHPFPSLSAALMTLVAAERWLRGPARRMMLEQAWDHDVARRVDWAVGAALLMRREALESVGPLNEKYFMYVEDLDWCWRAHQHGWHIWFEPDAVVRHIGNASGATRFGEARTGIYMANTYRFYREHHGQVRTAAYRRLNMLGVLRNYGLATLTRDEAAARFWRRRYRAYRGREPAAGGGDG